MDSTSWHPSQETHPHLQLVARDTAAPNGSRTRKIPSNNNKNKKADRKRVPQAFQFWQRAGRLGHHCNQQCWGNQQETSAPAPAPTSWRWQQQEKGATGISALAKGRETWSSWQPAVLWKPTGNIGSSPSFYFMEMAITGNFFFSLSLYFMEMTT